MYKTVEEYIKSVWTEERLNEYSYFSGWHDTIKEIIREVWSATQPVIEDGRVDLHDCPCKGVRSYSCGVCDVCGGQMPPAA